MAYIPAMAFAEPLPFRLSVPGSDTIDLDEIESVSYRVEGLLHFIGSTLTFEWAGARTRELVSLGQVKEENETIPRAMREVPVSWIAEVRVTGGWWRPRIHLRARRLDAFDGIPSAKPGAITLRINRRDRELAREIASGLEMARADEALAAAEHRRGLRAPDDTP